MHRILTRGCDESSNMGQTMQMRTHDDDTKGEDRCTVDHKSKLEIESVEYGSNNAENAR